MLSQPTRKPIVAGSFYPSDKQQLRDQLSTFFKKTKTASSCLGVVSPHAGYLYSGQTASWAIASLKTATTFVMLGPNHNTIGEQFAVSNQAWETPLGKVEVNQKLAKQLIDKCKGFLIEDPTAHMMEHSIEVQLPFLQQKFQRGKSTFNIVPISIMNLDYTDDFLEKCEKLGKAIASLVDLKTNNIGIVASSDFSHYLPKDLADQKDSKAVESILNQDPKGLFGWLDKIDGSVCGYGPIAVLVSAAKALGLTGKLINKSTSGDITGDNKSVVAYYAIGFG